MPIYIANVNAPCQIVIAGSNEGINQVLRAAQNSGARKAERLQVSVPSHCPLLESVAEALTESLRTTALQPPNLIYVSLSLIHISEPTRRTPISYSVFCLQK